MKKAIRSVKLIGERSVQQTGLLATYNMPAYSFFVEYENGQTETIEICPKLASSKEKKLFDTLMSMSNAAPSDYNTQTPTSYSSTNTDDMKVYQELKTLKELFDEGVLPEDIYTAKRQALLDILQGDYKTASKTFKDSAYIQGGFPKGKNLFVKRKKPKPSGESATHIYIDSEKVLDANLDSGQYFYLEPGIHEIYFSRGALRSKTTEITVAPGKYLTITFNPKLLSIEIVVE